MGKAMKNILLISFVLLLNACGSSEEQGLTQQSQAQKPITGRVLQYGLYTLVSGGEIIDDAKTTTGKGVSKPVITRDRTVDRIPLVRDKYMAYQYRLSGLPGKGRVKLRRVLKHPEFNLPDGSVSSGSDFSITKKLDRGKVFAFDAYALNEDYEMVEGEWVFQIWYKNEKLVEQKFTTYRPGEEEMARLTAPSWLDKKPLASNKSLRRKQTGY
jgi:hypothetical protein